MSARQRKFRFGVVASQAQSGREWAEKARRIEGLGFATLVMPDGIEHVLAPFSALAAAAAATTTLRVGTYVLANDYRHPLLVAKEAATLDVVSDGRFELGIGAGRPAAAPENAMLGLPFDSGGVRLARLAEALRIVKPLLVGERVDMAGEHYQIANAAIAPLPVQQPLPILMAAGQRRMLELAAREANIVALGVPPDASEAHVAQMVDWLCDAAGERFPEIELNLNLMAVGGNMPRYLHRTMGQAAAQLAESDAIPVLKGSTDAMAGQLLSLRERFGISYIMVSDELADAFAPVVARLAGS